MTRKYGTITVMELLYPHQLVLLHIQFSDISARLHCEVVLDGLDRYKVNNMVECTQFLPPAKIIRLKTDSTAISALAKKVHLAEELLSMPPSSKLLLKTLER